MSKHYPVQFQFGDTEICLTVEQAWRLANRITEAMGDRYFVSAVHDYHCPATKRGKKHGRCRCPIIDEAKP